MCSGACANTATLVAEFTGKPVHLGQGAYQSAPDAPTHLSLWDPLFAIVIDETTLLPSGTVEYDPSLYRIDNKGGDEGYVTTRITSIIETEK